MARMHKCVNITTTRFFNADSRQQLSVGKLEKDASDERKETEGISKNLSNKKDIKML